MANQSDAAPDGENMEEEGRSARNTVFTFRLPREELEALSRYAAHEGESATEYVRKAIKMRQERGDLKQNTVSVGTHYWQTGSMVSWTEAQVYIENEVTKLLQIQAQPEVRLSAS